MICFLDWERTDLTEHVQLPSSQVLPWQYTSINRKRQFFTIAYNKKETSRVCTALAAVGIVFTLGTDRGGWHRTNISRKCFDTSPSLLGSFLQEAFHFSLRPAVQFKMSLSSDCSHPAIHPNLNLSASSFELRQATLSSPGAGKRPWISASAQRATPPSSCLPKHILPLNTGANEAIRITVV